MDTIFATIFGGVGVTVLAFVFHKFGVKEHAQRAVVFVLCTIGAVAQLLLSHKLTLGSDPAVWFTAITSIQGVAQVFYGIIAAGLKWGSGGTTNPT